MPPGAGKPTVVEDCNWPTAPAERKSFPDAQHGRGRQPTTVWPALTLALRARLLFRRREARVDFGIRVARGGSAGRAICLPRRTLHSTERAEHAAVTGVRSQQEGAVPAHMEKLAGISGHGLALRVPTSRARQHGLEHGFVHGLIFALRGRIRLSNRSASARMPGCNTSNERPGTDRR